MMKQFGVKAAVALMCVLGVAVPAAADTVEVGAPGLSFSPANVVINQGDSVHWTGLTGGFHTVAEVDEGENVWNNGFHSAAAANEFTFTFNAAGVFHYVCEPHAPGMRGTVTVNDVIPTVSTWGVAALLLLVLVAGSVVFRRVKVTT